VSGSDEDVLRFIAANFPSVWTLEVLLTLKGQNRAWPLAELVTNLRASDLVVSKAIDALLVAGLVSVERGQAVYLPVNREVSDCVERVEQLYRTRPDMVRRAIIAVSRSSASAFAEAFKLRRNKDD
jgi:hypothetical protein